MGSTDPHRQPPNQSSLHYVILVLSCVGIQLHEFSIVALTSLFAVGKGICMTNGSKLTCLTFLTLPPFDCTVPAQWRLVALDTVIVLAYLLTYLLTDYLSTPDSVYILSHVTVMLSVYRYVLMSFHPSVLWCCWLGERKGIRLVKVLPQQFPRVFTFVDQPAWSILTWTNSGKMDQLNKNRLCVCVFVYWSLGVETCENAVVLLGITEEENEE